MTVLFRYGQAPASDDRPGEPLSLLDKLRHVHGEPRYLPVRRVLHQEVVDGQPALMPLDAALPG